MPQGEGHSPRAGEHFGSDIVVQVGQAGQVLLWDDQHVPRVTGSVSMNARIIGPSATRLPEAIPLTTAQNTHSMATGSSSSAKHRQVQPGSTRDASADGQGTARSSIHLSTGYSVSLFIRVAEAGFSTDAGRRFANMMADRQHMDTQNTFTRDGIREMLVELLNGWRWNRAEEQAFASKQQLCCNN